MDATAWSVWWHFNKEPYLDLRAHVRSGPVDATGEGWFLGFGGAADRSMKPTGAQIRVGIVPALLGALERETNNDIVTGCLIALAKIGEEGESDGAPRFATVIERFLADRNQEIGETAAVALGIMASPRSIETLAALLLDSDHGRTLVGRNTVPARTRAFAAYGLGLIGARNPDRKTGERIVVLLKSALETDGTASADLKVACVNATGLVPLEGLMRQAQIDTLLGLLEDEELDTLVRAHCPAAIGRLFPGLTGDRREGYRQRIVDALIRLTTDRQPAELVQGSVQALGLLGTNDGEDPLDRRIRKILSGSFRDQQARRFALIALAKVGARPGIARTEDGVSEVADSLLDRLARDRNDMRAWAGLSCGILARGLIDGGSTSPVIAGLQKAVRVTLEEERDPSGRAALAISCGIMGARDAASILLALLENERVDETRGHLAVALGLMGSREALGPVSKIVDESRYRPELLTHAAIALALLGDAAAVPQLVGHLSEARSLAAQASLSSALGFIGDKRSIDPLVTMLVSRERTERARAFAAVALGIVADKEPLPWNSKIAQDVNYRATPATLTDTGTGTGILDIL